MLNQAYNTHCGLSRANCDDAKCQLKKKGRSAHDTIGTRALHSAMMRRANEQELKRPTRHKTAAEAA